MRNCCGIKNECSKSYDLESSDMIEVNELSDQVHSSGKGICIIDVRTPSEWNAGHIKEAQHIELTALAYNIHKLPVNTPIFTICGSGYRGSVAATYLTQQGFAAVNVAGGMEAWKRAGLPIYGS